MKKHYLTIFSFVFLMSAYVQAQVGINNTDPKASLDVTVVDPLQPSAQDGLLIPRLDSFPGTNPGADQQSMIIYLTTADGLNDPGFYFWDNNAGTSGAWTALGDNNAIPLNTDFWQTEGNAGTTAANFLGTLDNQPLHIHTNDTLRMRVTTKGQLEVFNTGNSVFVGASAGANDDLSNNRNVFIGGSSGFLNETGSENIGMGFSSLLRNTDGSRNIAIGIGTMANNVSGSFNTALGSAALNKNITGNLNVSIGRNTMRDNNGAKNTGIGARSLQVNTIGNNNTVLGADTFYTNETGSGNVGLGYEAGYYEKGDNKLYINNSRDSIALVTGDFNIDRVGINKDVDSLTHTLTVGGDISADANIEINGVGDFVTQDGNFQTMGGDFITEANTYPDYVFEKYYTNKSDILSSYSFMNLEEAEAFVKENGHLPGVKSYEEIKANDFKIGIGETSITNLEKIEELFLYITELNTKLKEQKSLNVEKDQKIESLEKRLERLEALILEK
ncbi:autotransporter outer membrane beta-barrel domain-containing protein [Haloflavibacter putidus]|uniref:Peptidase S74 domain-containing protein n=1 Tax=Haloflavibacter putidus TaxID=2576776 RepID=A0A507ZNQ1_9FLAO|nr:hypothetical protein [Haloflavibacter putidus]TQD39160.1 hypothetical protein FKR84_07145 [Haloflavibacter putidus]